MYSQIKEQLYLPLRLEFMKKVVVFFFYFATSGKAQIQQFPDSINWKKVNSLTAVESGLYWRIELFAVHMVRG